MTSTNFRPIAYSFIYTLLMFVALASILAAVEGYYIEKREIFSEFWLKIVFFASYWGAFVFLLIAQYRLANDHKRLYCVFTLVGAILIIIASILAFVLAHAELSGMMKGVIIIAVLGGLANFGLAVAKAVVVKKED